MPQRKNRRQQSKKPLKSPRKKRIRSSLPFKFKAIDGKSYTLTPKQKHWCDVYLEEGANLTIASLETYKVTNKHLCKIPWGLLTDKEKRWRIRAEDVAHHIGKENFGKPRIFGYVNKILADAGYTDERVRLKHFSNMMQDKSISASNQAIDMYYKAGGKYKDDERGYKDEIEAFFKGVKSLVKK